MNLRSSRIITLDLNPVAEMPFTAIIPINGQNYTLDLVPYSNRSPDYRVITQVEGGAYVEV